MGVRKKNRRKIHVRDRLFLWWIEDCSDDEGLWYVNIVADDNKQHQFFYSLDEAELVELAENHPEMPLPDDFDRQTLTLSDARVSKDIGGDRHALATPAFVRRLIEWHIEHVW